MRANSINIIISFLQGVRALESNEQLLDEFSKEKYSGKFIGSK